MNNVKFSGWSFLVINLVAVLMLIIGGCAAPGRTKHQVHEQHINTIGTNWLMVQDDLDQVLLLEKPSRLSEMTVR